MDEATRNSKTNANMFVSAMQYALGHAVVLVAFHGEVGRSAPPRGLTPLGQVMEKSTGVDRALFEVFADWFADTHWGRKNAPDMSIIFKTKTDT